MCRREYKTQIATKIAAHLPISASATESLVEDCDGACRSLQSTLAGLALTVNALFASLKSGVRAFARTVWNSAMFETTPCVPQISCREREH